MLHRNMDTVEVTVFCTIDVFLSPNQWRPIWTVEWEVHERSSVSDLSLDEEVNIRISDLCTCDSK